MASGSGWASGGGGGGGGGGGSSAKDRRDELEKEMAEKAQSDHDDLVTKLDVLENDAFIGKITEAEYNAKLEQIIQEEKKLKKRYKSEWNFPKLKYQKDYSKVFVDLPFYY